MVTDRFDRRGFLSVWVACLVGLGWPAGVLRAQVVDVRVVESVGGLPAPSAIVALRRANGTLVERRLTDLQGRARFTGMGLGTFLLEADQIGARRSATPTFLIETVSDTVRHRLVMVARPFTLPDVNVASREVACAAGGVDGADLVAVWEEARKALTATVLTEESVQPLLQRWRWVRRLDRNQRERGEQSNRVEYTRGAPFVSAPAEELRDRGYIVLGDSLDTFYAPDARVLLDEGFLESHCFRLDVETRRAEGLVGLQFAPLTGRKVPEIEGTLWLRRRGAELAEITYRYVKLPREFRGNPEFGGRVAFAPVPGIGWIVREWSLQTPVYGVRADGGGFSGYSLQTTVTSEAVARRRLADAMSIVGWHLEGGTGQVAGEGTPLLPSAPGLRQNGAEPGVGQPRLCRSGADVGDGLGAVVVRVEWEDSAVVAPDVPVVVVVGDAEVQSVRLANDRQLSVVRPAVQIDGMSSREGFVAVCGVPVGARVRVHAGSVEAPPVHAEVTESPVPVRVAYRPVAPRPVAPAGVLHGRVIDSAGIGLPDVQVVIAGAGRFVMTDSGGRYRVTGVPEGRFEVIFRRLGYQPGHTFRAFRQDTSRVDMRLQAQAFVLPEITAEARGVARPTPKMAGFLDRRAMGFGSFIDETVLREREYSPLSMVLRGHVAGVTLVHLANNQGYGVMMSRVPKCWAQVFLDGMRIVKGGEPYNIDQHTVQSLMAVEVYKGAASTPVQFGGGNSSCGTVLLWTRDR
jgi:hypothetical protein